MWLVYRIRIRMSSRKPDLSQLIRSPVGQCLIKMTRIIENQKLTRLDDLIIMPIRILVLPKLDIRLTVWEHSKKSTRIGNDSRNRISGFVGAVVVKNLNRNL